MSSAPPDTAARPDPGTPDGAAPDSILRVSGLEVVYRSVILAVRGVSLEVPEGSIVAVLGSNGAGKTSLLRAITGLLDVHHGEITKGTIAFAGKDITNADPAKIVRSGVAQVMEGRRVFTSLTVEENLRAGGYTVRSRSELREHEERVYELFPKLVERRSSIAGYLSGGEQQMLAIGRALMASPRLLLLDEPSLGLAPLIVKQISEIIAEVNRSGVSVVLVEQNATMALALADHGTVVENGRVVKDGTGEALRNDKDIQEFYLGTGEAGRRNFRDVKTYRRKKRWSA